MYVGVPQTNRTNQPRRGHDCVPEDTLWQTAARPSLQAGTPFGQGWYWHARKLVRMEPYKIARLSTMPSPVGSQQRRVGVEIS